MRRWLVAVGALMLAAVAVVVAVAAGAGEGSRPDSAGSPPSTASATSSPSPSPGPASNSEAASKPTPTPEPSPPAPRGTFVIWARGDLPRSFADAVDALAEVTATTYVRSGTVGLVASRASDGSPVDVLEDGFRIPVDVVAVDPVSYGAFLGNGQEHVVAALTPGVALLSETSARLRGIRGGGQVDLASLGGLDIIDVVPDGVVSRGEVILHADDATAAGLDEDGTVFLRHDAAPGAETDALRDQIEALVPPELTARIVDATAGQGRRRAPLVLSLLQVKERFGEFSFRARSGAREIEVEPAFVEEHIVTVDVPILGSVTCHRGIVDDLRAALTEIVDADLADEIDPRRYAGCFYPRRISEGGDRLSHHSWGIALDINVDLSLPGGGPPPSPEVIDAFETNGFRWGGDFLQPDNHHFEWIGTGRE